MKNNIKENYLGLSFFNQLKIYDKFLETLQIKKNKKVLRGLKDTFDNYFNFKINLHEAINNVTYLNKNELDELKNDLLEQIREYESYDYEKKDSFREKIRCFNYHLGSYFPFGTRTNLNKMLFFPEKLTDSDTDLFIEEYDQLPIEEKMNTIEYFTYSYDLLNEFFLPREVYFFGSEEDIENTMKEVLKDSYERYENLSTDNKFSILENLIIYVNNYLDNYEIKFSTRTQKPSVEKTTTNKKQVKQKYINKKFTRRY